MSRREKRDDAEPEAAGGCNAQSMQNRHHALLRAAQEAVRDTTRLTRLFTILSEPAPLELMLDRVLSTLSELFSADIVALIDPVGSGTFSPLAVVGLPEYMIHLPMSSAVSGCVYQAMSTRSPIVKESVSLDSAVESQLRESGAETAVWVPVIGSHAARGALILARCHPTPFEGKDVALLSAMAHRIGLALEQAQRSLQLEQIVRAGRKISRTLIHPELFTETVNMLPAVLGADAAVFVLNDAKGRPRCVARNAIDPQWDDQWVQLSERLLADSHFAGFKPYAAIDFHAEENLLSMQPPETLPVGALLAIPVHLEGRIQGLLIALRSSIAPFGPDTVQIAMLYASQMSAAMANASLYQSLQEELAERMRVEHRLVESEERLQLALKGADLGMWDWNIPTGEIRLNERWPSMLGYDPYEIEPNVLALKELINPEDLPRVRESLQSHFKGRTPSYVSEYRLLSKKGDWIWVLDKGKVTHRDPDGQPLRLVGTCLDISESKQIQAERLVMEQQKHHAWRSESLRRMAGGIAHHFNNLLQVVMGNMELALQFLPPEMKAGQFIAEAMKASGRASEIGQLMLAYLGQKTGKVEALDLAEAVRKVLHLLMSSMPKSVHLKTDLPNRGPIIQADGVHIKQILTSLISNAQEAIGDQPGEITVTIGMIKAGDLGESRFLPVDWRPEPGTYASLLVSDTGSGMAPSTQERIFEPFFTTRFTGRGLGMSVTLGLIQSYGGAISFLSGMGRGTTFQVVFPVSPQELQPAVVPTESRLPTGPRGLNLALLVDDDPMIRIVAQAQLEKLGYKVIQACDGVEAVDTFRTKGHEIRVVLLDLSMPRMDGWETLAALRAVRPDIPVVIASGYDETEAMQGFQNERPQAFLHKPYQIADLRQALDAAQTAACCSE